MRKSWIVVMSLGVTLLAGGCQGTLQEKLGLGKRTPDEFQVVRRQPLVIPPDYALRPPAPGEVGPAQSPSAEAQALLTGSPAATQPQPANQSGAEVALLSASPVKADAGVRSEITQESGDLVQLADRTFLFILDFQKKQFQPKSEVLNPQAEAGRLAAQGTSAGVVTSRISSTPQQPSS